MGTVGWTFPPVVLLLCQVLSQVLMQGGANLPNDLYPLTPSMSLTSDTNSSNYDVVIDELSQDFRISLETPELQKPSFTQPIYLNHPGYPVHGKESAVQDGDHHAVHKRSVRYNSLLRRLRMRRRRRRRRRKWKFRMDRSLPRWCRMHFDDVILSSHGNGYIFSKTAVYKINNKGTLPGYPVHVTAEFPGAPINPLAVVYIRDTGHTYFFKDNRIWRYNGTTLDSDYPKVQRRKFAELPRAALAMKDHKGRTMVFIFGNRLMWRWNFRSERMSGRYHLINTYWKGLPRTLDAAVEWSDHYIYFFRRNKYYKMSTYHKVKMKNYPRFKGSAWLGGVCGTTSK